MPAVCFKTTDQVLTATQQVVVASDPDAIKVIKEIASILIVGEKTWSHGALQSLAGIEVARSVALVPMQYTRIITAIADALYAVGRPC